MAKKKKKRRKKRWLIVWRKGSNTGFPHRGWEAIAGKLSSRGLFKSVERRLNSLYSGDQSKLGVYFGVEKRGANSATRTTGESLDKKDWLISRKQRSEYMRKGRTEVEETELKIEPVSQNRQQKPNRLKQRGDPQTLLGKAGQSKNSYDGRRHHHTYAEKRGWGAISRHQGCILKLRWQGAARHQSRLSAAEEGRKSGSERKYTKPLQIWYHKSSAQGD